MLLEFACQFRGGSIARCQDNKSLDDLTAHFIGTGNHRRLGNGGVLFQCTFHLEGADTVACADNHIICSSDKPEVAILVLVGTIPGDVPIATNTGLRCLRVAPVFFKHPRWAPWLYLYRDITFLVRRKLAAVVVDHAHLETWRRLAHRARLHLQGRKVGTKEHRFGLAVAIANSHPCVLLPRSYYLWIEWLSRTNTVPQRLGGIVFQIGQGFI